MKEQFRISEFDVVFLSYDEPNAEKHWADLLDKAPWAKRVHKVKGFDAAHRAAAQQSDTPWFVTVDADNIVDPAFFDQVVELDVEADANRCFSWNAVNMMNGLMYGNGGLKLWSKEFVLNMNSHEHANDPRKAIDFCWEDDYQQVHRTFSEVWNNASPYQAFRVGYREGVKLALDRGERVSASEMKTRLHPVNLRNLRIWCSVGADVDNGLWAIYGARLGFSSIIEPSFNMTVVRDYDWFDLHWEEHVKPAFFTDGQFDEAKLKAEAIKLGNTICDATRIKIPLLDSDASVFFRETFKFRND